MHFQPFVRVLFAAAYLSRTPWSKIFRAAAGDRAKTGLAQSLECFTDGGAKDTLGKMSHFDGGEGLDVKIGIERAQLAQKFQVPLLLQGRMQTADHVNFANAQA